VSSAFGASSVLLVGVSAVTASAARAGAIGATVGGPLERPITALLPVTMKSRSAASASLTERACREPTQT